MLVDQHGVPLPAESEHVREHIARHAKVLLSGPGAPGRAARGARGAAAGDDEGMVRVEPGSWRWGIDTDQDDRPINSVRLWSPHCSLGPPGTTAASAQAMTRSQGNLLHAFG